MTPEEVAQKFEQRIGFELVDYAEVGLPIYRLSVDVVTVSIREISSINEFVLRLADASPSSPAFIGGFLGLPDTILAASLTELRDLKWIYFNSNDNVCLTEKGKEVNRIGRDRAPQDETLWVDFDGITRRPIALGREVMIKPSELAIAGRLEIRPYPAEPPSVSDLRLTDVQETVRKQITRREEPAEILAINKINRRFRLYRHAVCLVYKAARTKSIQVSFAINGVRSEEHEREFARNKGPEKMGFTDNISENDVRQNLRRLLGQAAASKVPDQESVRAARVRASGTKLIYDGARVNAQRMRDKQSGQSAEAKAASAKLKYEEAKGALDMFPVRPLAVYEHVEYLFDALYTAQQKLVLSSPMLLPTVIDPSFIRGINRLLANKVEVHIYLQQLPSANVISKYETFSDLMLLSERSPRLSVRQMRRGPINWLIKDREFVITTSFPWLAYKDKRRPLRRETGLVIRDPSIIDELLKNLELRVAK